MMILNVQTYLQSGKTLENLKEEHGIKYNETDDLVVLNYDQINSTKTNPIVMECRALILEKGSWNIVSKAFHRFFNHGEVLSETETFDLEKATAVEKVDGSIISVFYYNKWRMSTRGLIDGSGNVSFCDMTFNDLFNKTVGDNFYDKLDKKYVYIFELTSPENRVVKPYSERSLHLLTMRDNINFIELSKDEVDEFAELIGVNRPKHYTFSNIAELRDMVVKLKDLDEGFVCVDYTKQINGNYPRIKFKSPTYIAVAHLKESSSSSMRALMQLVMVNEQDEFISYFPEYKVYVDKIAEKYKEYVKGVQASFFNIDKSLDRKEFANWAKTTVCPSIMFMAYDGKINSWKEYLDYCIETKGVKNMSSSMLKTLGINDMTFNN